jgi:hypothetical protein
MTKANIGNSQVVIKIGRNTVLKAYRGSNILYNPAPAAPISVSPLHLANGFLSTLRNDTINESEFPNAVLSNGYLNVLRLENTPESEFPNAVLSNGYLNVLRLENTPESEFPNAVLSNGYLGVLHIDSIAILLPNAPTSLSATAGNTQIVLSWTAPTNTSISDYTVEYTPSGGSAATVDTGSMATSYTLTGLTNGTAYTVRVRAVSAAGNGNYSTAETGTPSVSVPGVPTSASLRNEDCGDVIVEWQPPASDGGSPITGYRVIAATTYWGNCKPLGSAPSNSTNCGHDVTYSAATRSARTAPPGATIIRFAIFAINSVGSSEELVISASHANGFCN